jgi:serine/threonine-protein kinase
VLLLDFGIVALTSKQDQRLTADGVVFGTPIYLAPEIMDNNEPNARTDVYSLAVVAFELMTGRAPFEADSSLRIMQLKSAADAPTMHAVSGLPFSRELEQAVARGLTRDPKQRFASAGDFVRALEKAAQRPPAQAATGSPDGAPGSPDAAVEAREQQQAAHEQGADAHARLATLGLGEAGVKTDVHLTLGQRLADRKGLLLAACVGPLIGVALAWGLPTSELATPPPTALQRSAAAAPPALPRPAPTPAASTAQPAIAALEPATPPASEPRPVEARGTEPRAAAREPSRADARGSAREQNRERNEAATPAALAPAPAPTVRVERSTGPAVVSTGDDGSTLVKAAAQALVAGNLEQADRLYADATRREPRSAAAWRGLGLTSERLGRRDAAIQAFQRSLELTPAGPQADSIRARIAKLTGAR